MTQSGDFVVVSTTVDSESKARELAGRLVRERLAACVHRMPIRSTYRWKGEIEEAEEHVLAAKTKASLAGEIIDFIKGAHDYEVPEIIVTPVVDGLRSYLDWVGEETKG